MKSPEPRDSAPGTAEVGLDGRSRSAKQSLDLRVLLFGPLLVGALSLGASYLIPPTFTARTVLLPPQQQQSATATALQSLGALAGMAGGTTGIRSPVDQYVALMQSTTVEDRLIDTFKLMDVYGEDKRSEARRELEKRTRVSAGKKDGLLAVEVDDEDPKRAADIANAYVDELRKLTSALAMTEAQQRRLFFEKQLSQTRDELAAAQRALQSSGINEGALRAEPKSAAEAYARLQAEITAGEVRIQMLQGYLADSAPELVQARAQLAALRTQLAKREAMNIRGSQGDYIDRYREFRYQESLFELLLRQYEMARIDESREGALIQVVDVATPPDHKSKPKRVNIAFFSSVGAAVVLLLWFYARRTWLRTERPGVPHSASRA